MNLEKIKEALPDEAISPHPTKPYLSSIKAIYVTERFNEVFWVWKWQVRVEHIVTGEKGMIVIKVTFTVPEENIYYECFWGNDNWWEWNKNFDLWDAYKWATTDALTKIWSYLWIWIDVFKWKYNWETKNNSNKKEVKWYNDVEKNIDDWSDMINDWKTTPEQIIERIETQGFSLSKANKQKILDLKNNNG